VIKDLHVGMKVRWADEFTMNKLTEGKRTGEIVEIAHHKQSGVPAVAIKFQDGTMMGMFALDCRLKMTKNE